jgi:hypothetical protein
MCPIGAWWRDWLTFALHDEATRARYLLINGGELSILRQKDGRGQASRKEESCQDGPLHFGFRSSLSDFKSSYALRLGSFGDYPDASVLAGKLASNNLFLNVSICYNISITGL